MKNQACVAFLSQVVHSEVEFELSDEQRLHLDDCDDCNCAYLNAGPRWFANEQFSKKVAETPALQAIEKLIAFDSEEVVTAMRMMDIPDEVLYAMVWPDPKKDAVN